MNGIREICVLGGTGFIGSRLVAALASRGVRVRVPSRNPYRNRSLSVLPRVRVFAADVHDPETLARSVAGCEAVINLVGVLHDTRAASFRTVHVELPRKLAHACRAAGVGRVLHVSALRADASDGPSAYLRSKGEGEAALRIHAGDEVGVTVFRPSVVFGPGDGFISRFAGLVRVAPGIFPLARADARFQPVYVGDVVAALVAALADRRTAGCRYALCGPRVYALADVVQLVATQLGRRTRILRLPDGLGRLQAAALEWIPGKPFTRDAFRSLTVDSVCDGGPGLPELGVAPTALEPVLARHLARSA